MSNARAVCSGSKTRAVSPVSNTRAVSLYLTPVPSLQAHGARAGPYFMQIYLSDVRKPERLDSFLEDAWVWEGRQDIHAVLFHKSIRKYSLKIRNSHELLWRIV